SGDARTLLKQDCYWIWQTQEVLDLIEWLRAYNADPSHVQKVRFAGFDSYLPTPAGLDRIVQYVQQVDPSRSVQVAERYHELAAGSFGLLPVLSVRQQWLETAEQVYALLHEQEQTYLAHSSPSEYQAILQEAHVVIQAMLRIQSDDAAPHSEELRAMAELRDHFM